MPTLFKIIDATEIAIRIIKHLTEQDSLMDSVDGITKKLFGPNASKSHIAKIVQVLKRQGILMSTRGCKGGYTLQNPDVTVKTIIESIEGPFIYHVNPITLKYNKDASVIAENILAFFRSIKVRDLNNL